MSGRGWPDDMIQTELDLIELGDRVVLRMQDVKAWRKVKR